MDMKLLSLAELEIDRKYAPGWSLRECMRRKAFLVKLDADVAWVAAVRPKDVSVLRDMRWLTNRTNIRVAGISEETLREALELFCSD
jgi:hypothetical protein